MAKSKTTPRDDSGKFTKAAPVKKTVKKAVKDTAIQTPAKAVAPTVPLSEYEKKVEELREATANKVSIKTELSKWKDRAISAEHKVSELGDQIGEKETGWLRWISKHVLATILIVVVIAAGCWLYVIYGQRNDAIDKVQPLQDHISRLQRDSAFLRAGNRYDSIYAENGKIPTPDTEGEKKNSNSRRTK